MSDRLPTHVLVSAAIRHAANADAVIVVIYKGDPDRGAVLIKTNNLAGQFSLHQQIYDGTCTVYIELLASTADEAKVNAEIARQHGNDPDAWVVEVEDRASRLWLDNLF